jgi:hypothetical protein
MTHPIRYSFTHTPPSISPTPSDAPLYAAEDGLVASLSSQECVFKLKRTGAAHVMTFQVLQAMDLCREFRTLDEHVSRIQATIAGLAGKREEVRRVLDSLIARGLLRRDTDFIAALQRAPMRDPAPLRAVFLRACDRPPQLAQLLRSLADYERRFRAGRHYVLIDDSALAAHVDEQRDLLREFARTTGCRVTYLGRAEIARIVERLGKACPQARSVIGRLLTRAAQPHPGRFGGGRGINLALLLGAGARLAILDDDQRLPLKRPEFVKPGFDPNPNPAAEVRFFANLEQALGAGEEIDEDPFELHLAACGQTLGAVITERYPLDRAALRGLHLGRLELLAAEARIATTHHGSFGNTRTESSLWLYQSLEGASLAEFWRDRESYLRNAEGHFLLYAMPQARADAVPGFTPFLLDASRMLPCTTPVGRAEDSLCGVLTRFCLPDTIALELPVVIGHVQEALRPRAEKARQALWPRVNDFLRDFVRRHLGQFQAEDPMQRMRLLGEILHDLAQASVAARVEQLDEYVSYVRADLIDRLQHRLEALDEAPIYWQADVRAIVQANAKALLTPAPPRLAEWPEDLDAAGCAAALREELGAFADACSHWPALWQFAAEQGGKLLATA